MIDTYIYMDVSQLSICRLIPLRSGHIYKKDAHCAEPNEKSIFRFLFFVLPWLCWQCIDCIYSFWWHTWISKCITDQKNKSFKSGQIYRNDVQWVETNEKSIIRFLRFLVFELWLILYSKIIEFRVQKRPYFRN